MKVTSIFINYNLRLISKLIHKYYHLFSTSLLSKEILCFFYLNNSNSLFIGEYSLLDRLNFITSLLFNTPFYYFAYKGFNVTDIEAVSSKLSIFFTKGSSL